MNSQLPPTTTSSASSMPRSHAPSQRSAACTGLRRERPEDGTARSGTPLLLCVAGRGGRKDGVHVLLLVVCLSGKGCLTPLFRKRCPAPFFICGPGRPAAPRIRTNRHIRNPDDCDRSWPPSGGCEPASASCDAAACSARQSRTVGHDAWPSARRETNALSTHSLRSQA